MYIITDGLNGLESPLAKGVEGLGALNLNLNS